jgi:23S rRNA (guanosine2251-2'-O)-methyltransferase
MSESNFIFLFGINPVKEKLNTSPRDIIEIVVSKERQSSAVRSVEHEARQLGLPVRQLESRVLDRLADGGRHQGIVAKVAAYTYADFSLLLRDLAVSPGPDWILVLDSVTDPRNFGALLRTAEATGVRHVVIPKDRAVGVTPVVFKASAGAASHLRIYRVTNLRESIASLKKRSYWVVGLSARASQSVYSRTYPDRLVVVLGAEGKGIRPLIERECDFVVSIPMKGKISSLNVAVAGGVFLYEVLRQREFPKKLESAS